MSERDVFSSPVSLDAVSRSMWLLGSVLARTWRYRFVGAVQTDPFRPSPAVATSAIYCTWHGNLLPVFYRGKNSGLTALVSRSRDGTRLSAILLRWGYQLIRGSSSRSGAEALDQCITLVGKGGQLMITPDGPRGPAGKAKYGVARISRETGVAVTPLACHVQQCVRLKTWDRFVIPLPFATITVRVGAPVCSADYDQDAQGLDRMTADIGEGMHFSDQ